MNLTSSTEAFLSSLEKYQQVLAQFEKYAEFLGKDLRELDKTPYSISQRREYASLVLKLLYEAPDPLKLDPFSTQGISEVGSIPSWVRKNIEEIYNPKRDAKKHGFDLLYIAYDAIIHGFPIIDLEGYPYPTTGDQLDIWNQTAQRNQYHYPHGLKTSSLGGFIHDFYFDDAENKRVLFSFLNRLHNPLNSELDDLAVKVREAIHTDQKLEGIKCIARELAIIDAAMQFPIDEIEYGQGQEQDNQTRRDLFFGGLEEEFNDSEREVIEFSFGRVRSSLQCYF